MPHNPLPRQNIAIIFAGGKSSRMGKDKSLLPFGGYSTLSEYQYRRLGKLFNKVYFSTREAKLGFKAVLIHDLYQESSPLVGLVSVFETISEDECFILSVDAPFVNAAVIKKLYDESADASLDAIVAQSPGGTQPLCGIYRKSIIPLARKYISRNKHKLNTLLQEAKSHYVKFEDEAPFINLNYPHEYEAAVKTLKNQKS